jgi:hypothetical protein
VVMTDNYFMDVKLIHQTVRTNSSAVNGRKSRQKDGWQGFESLLLLISEFFLDGVQ